MQCQAINTSRELTSQQDVLHCCDKFARFQKACVDHVAQCHDAGRCGTRTWMRCRCDDLCRAIATAWHERGSSAGNIPPHRSTALRSAAVAVGGRRTRARAHPVIPEPHPRVVTMHRRRTSSRPPSLQPLVTASCCQSTCFSTRLGMRSWAQLHVYLSDPEYQCKIMLLRCACEHL